MRKEWKNFVRQVKEGYGETVGLTVHLDVEVYLSLVIIARRLGVSSSRLTNVLLRSALQEFGRDLLLEQPELFRVDAPEGQETWAGIFREKFLVNEIEDISELYARSAEYIADVRAGRSLGTEFVDYRDYPQEWEGKF